MMLKVSNYDLGYHIASFAKSKEVLEDMRSKSYDVVYFDGEKLIFYPELTVIKLIEEECSSFQEITEYSVLEFDYGGAFIYYDASSEDNALFITNRCNSNCIMCPTSSKIRRTSKISELANLIKICSQIPNDTPHITITGGEPFLLGEDIFSLLAYLKENLNEVEYLLLTNGRIFSNKQYFQQFKESVPDNIIIGIPIHGYDSATHDFITRTNGSFIQTFKGLKNLLSTRIRIELRIVVSRLNANFIDKIVDLIIREFSGVYTIKFIGLEMLGNARLNMSQVWMDYKESFQYMKSPIRKLILHGFNVGIYNYPLCCVEKGYWAICEKSITDYKIRYLSECEKCKKKDACGGMFSGTFRLMEGVVKPIL